MFKQPPSILVPKETKWVIGKYDVQARIQYKYIWVENLLANTNMNLFRLTFCGKYENE